MNNDYLEAKAVKKDSAKKGVWILVVLGVAFIFIIVRYAQNAGVRFSTSGLPTGTEAYEVSKEFVKSTVRSDNVEFSSSGFQFAKRSDSIYVIRAEVQLNSNSGDKKTVNYKVLMQYHGGKQDELKNWSLMNISEEQQ